MQNYAQGAGRNITYPIGLDGGTVGNQWGLDRSSFVIVGTDGIVKYITPQSTPYSNRLTQHHDELTATLDALILETGVEQQKESVPQAFRLQQNYPNPFNTITSLRYTLGFHTNSGFTQVIIYDILGRQVKTIASGYLLAGNYETVWNALDNHNNPVSAGVYFVLLKSGKHQLT